MLNKVQLIGRLGRDPDIRYTPEQTAVANLAVATSEYRKDKHTGERKDLTEWHRVVLFGKLAEIAGEHLKKGGLIYLEGSIRTRKWQKDGQDQYTTEIVASEMKMLGSKNGFASAPPASTPNNHSTGNNASQFDDWFEEDDIPF